MLHDNTGRQGCNPTPVLCSMHSLCEELLLLHTGGAREPKVTHFEVTIGCMGMHDMF